MNPTPDDRLDQLISQVGLGVFPSDVQDEVETILDVGQALEPEARGRFVDAAKRGSRHVALSHSALEVLLFNERRERKQEADELAVVVGIGADTIRAIERGERTIDSEGAGAVAVWALTLGVDRLTVDDALRRSLGTPVGAKSYAGERQFRLTTEQKDFIQRVLRAFDGHNDAAAAE